VSVIVPFVNPLQLGLVKEELTVGAESEEITTDAVPVQPPEVVTVMLYVAADKPEIVVPKPEPDVVPFDQL